MSKSFEFGENEENIFAVRERAFQRAKRLRAMNTPVLEEFFDVTGFSNRKIQADLRYVAKRKTDIADTRFRVEQARRADVLEAILAEQIELSDWLGQGTETVFASEYDDIAHGVDFAIVLPGLRESDARYLAVDVTFSAKHIESKLQRVKEAIDAGTLTRIDYCQDSEGTKHSPGRVPQCVLLFNEREMDGITRLWMDRKTKDLGAHPFQYALVEQLGCQLLMFEQYAKRIGNTELEAIFLQMKELLALGLPEERYRNVSLQSFETVQQLRESFYRVFGNRLIFPKGTRSFTEWACTLERPVEPEEEPEEMCGGFFTLSQLTEQLRVALGEPQLGRMRVHRYATVVASELGLLPTGDFALLPADHPLPTKIYPEGIRQYPEALLARLIPIFQEADRFPVAPEGWKTNAELTAALQAKGVAITSKTVRRYADTLQQDGQIQPFRSARNRRHVFYAPELCTAIEHIAEKNQPKQEEVTVVPWEAGWVSLAELSSEFAGQVSIAVVRKIWDSRVDEALAAGQVKVMKKEKMNPFEYGRADFIAEIRKEVLKVTEIPEPQEGEMTRPMIIEHLGAPRKTVMRLLDQATKLHPEWKIQRKPKMAKAEWYYLPQAIEAIRPEVEYINGLESPKTGEMTVPAITRWVKDLGFLHSPVFIQKIARGVVQNHHDDVHDRIVPDGNYYPHYSTEAILAIRAEVERRARIPPKTENDLNYRQMQAWLQSQGPINTGMVKKMLTDLVAHHPDVASERRLPDNQILLCYQADKALPILTEVLRVRETKR